MWGMCSPGEHQVFDVASRQIAREFEGHENRINDMAFSPDGRLLVSASMDGTVRVFDVVSAYMVDWFAFKRVRPLSLFSIVPCRELSCAVLTHTPWGQTLFRQAVTSLSFHPQSRFLLTTHVGDPALYLWYVMSLFSACIARAWHEGLTFSDMCMYRTGRIDCSLGGFFSESFLRSLL